MAEEPTGSEDDFVFEEHSGESGGDEAAAGLELDEFQAKEIRQIFLNTLPEYLEPVSQMLEQVLSGADGQPEIRRALQTTLSSIAAAASRVGIVDVSGAVDEMRDQLFALDDEPSPPGTELERALRESFAALEGLAGGPRRGDGATKQTIVAALSNVEGVDKSALERLTAAGLVTVDQLRVAKAQEIVAVTGLDAKVVDRLLALVLGSATATASVPVAKPEADPGSVDNLEEFRPLELHPARGTPADDSRHPPRRVAIRASTEKPSARAADGREKLAEKLRAQVDIEASVDELRSQILRERLRISACKERLSAAELKRNRLERELSAKRADLARQLTHLTELRLEQSRLERELADQQTALEAATKHLATLREERQGVVAQRNELKKALSELVNRIGRVKRSLDVVERENDRLSPPKSVSPTG